MVSERFWLTGSELSPAGSLSSRWEPEGWTAWQPGHWLPTAAPHAPAAPPCHPFPRWASWLGCPLLQPGGEDAPLPPGAALWVWAGAQGLGRPQAAWLPAALRTELLLVLSPGPQAAFATPGEEQAVGGPARDTRPASRARRGGTEGPGERGTARDPGGTTVLCVSVCSCLRASLVPVVGVRRAPCTHCCPDPSPGLSHLGTGYPAPSFRPPASSFPGSLPCPPRSPGQAQGPVAVPRPAVCVPRLGTCQLPRCAPVPEGASRGRVPPLQRPALSQAD